MTEDEELEALTEAKIMGHLDHPNIILFREVYRTKSKKLCIVMDYADNGDMASRIKSARAEKKYLKED